MNFKRTPRVNHDRTEPSNDYLKYWKVVKQWAKTKYNMNTADIEMMLFLYSEGLFTLKQFQEYDEIMSWDKNRFYNLLNDKWIIVWRKRKGKESTLYELGFSGKRMCSAIYRKLNKQETISEEARRNPMFNHKADYGSKVYRKMIKRMNLETKKSQQK
jgi:hypothetical protein